MDRRRFLEAAGSLGSLGLAGCTASRVGAPQSTVTTTRGSLEGTLTVATYGSFVDAPSSSPGPWIKKEFERRHPDVTLEWATPEGGVNHYIQRRQQGVDLGADAYIGLKVPELVRIDRKLDDPLFEAVDTGRLANFDHVQEGYALDPDDRVLPVFTGYMSFVYNDYEVDAPGTLDALTRPEYEGKLTVQNAQTDNTGLYFLLWTVKVKGEDGYLDYWRALLDNDLTVLKSWGEVYESFTSGKAAIVTSYSTDQVYAKRYDQDLKKHQVAFPGGHGYTNLSGMGKFATSEKPALTRAFLNFMLGPDAQGKLAELNVSFPVTDHATVPEVFQKYAKKPPEPLLYTYDELTGKVGTWRDDWARVVAGQ